jgi:hypothetical protein
MRLNRSASTFALVALTLLCIATMAFAVTIRGASGNGEDSGAPHWLLLGRSRDVTLTNNGKVATMRWEIVCPNQDAEDSQPSPVLTLSGSCDTNAYLFVFQFQSSATNLNVVIGNLHGFDSTNANNFGVMRCDSPNNTIELCTNATISQIPNITATATTNAVTFAVPGTFPTYPWGTTQQGRGLTFFILTQQLHQLPISVPTVSIR